MRVNFNQDGCLNYAGLSGKCNFDKLCDGPYRQKAKDVKIVNLQVINKY